MRNILSVDLNLLNAFDAMMRERNVTRAAERIGLAQPSMSNALSRLRFVMNDELFVRSPEGMVPTKLAVDMDGHVTAALTAAEQAINVGQSFDPASARTQITIATTDAVDFIFMPKILQHLGVRAPGMQIRTRAFDRDSFISQLDRQEVDLAVGVAPDPVKRIRAKDFYQETFVCIARKSHPLISGSLDLKQFLSSDHALFSQRGDGRGVVDTVLERMGYERNIVTSIANYTALPHLIASTDTIAVVAKRLALRASEHLPINIYPLPFEMGGFTMRQFWGMGTDRDPAQKWFRAELMSLVK